MFSILCYSSWKPFAMLILKYHEKVNTETVWGWMICLTLENSALLPSWLLSLCSWSNRLGGMVLTSCCKFLTQSFKVYCYCISTILYYCVCLCLCVCLYVDIGVGMKVGVWARMCRGAHMESVLFFNHVVPGLNSGLGANALLTHWVILTTLKQYF